VASSFLSPLLSRPDEPWILTNTRTAQPLARAIETAFDSSRRNKGLLGRQAFAPGSALILAPCSAIHTFFMRFPIDVAFVNREGVVVSVVHALAPWRIRAAFRAFATVELPAGVLASSGTRQSDLLRLDAG
jgi:uncharacterized protein